MRLTDLHLPRSRRRVYPRRDRAAAALTEELYNRLVNKRMQLHRLVCLLVQPERARELEVAEARGVGPRAVDEVVAGLLSVDVHAAEMEGRLRPVPRDRAIAVRRKSRRIVRGGMQRICFVHGAAPAAAVRL